MPDPRPFLPRVSVWPTGQADLPTQLAAGGYLPATAADTGGLPPAVAAHAVHAYTGPGDVVLDPDCGAGTVLVEAVRAGCHAVGVTGRRWWPTARANLTAAKLAGAPADGMVLDRRPGRSRPGRPTASTARTGTIGTASTATGPAGLTGLAGLTGRVELILTAVRPHRQPGGPAREAEDRLADLFAPWVPLLRPGGHAVVIGGPVWRSGRLVDLPGILTAAARQAGFVLVERCIALTAPAPYSPASRSPDQRRPGRPPEAAERDLTGGHPAAGPAYLDVYVFGRPAAEAAQAAALPVPPAAVAAAGPAGPAGPGQPTGVQPTGVRATGVRAVGVRAVGVRAVGVRAAGGRPAAGRWAA